MDNIQKEENEEIIYFCFFEPRELPESYLYSLFSKYSFSSFGVVIDGYLYKVGFGKAMRFSEYDRKHVLLPLKIKKGVIQRYLLNKVLNDKYSLIFNNCISGWKWLFLRLGFKWNRMFNIPNVFYKYVSKKTK